MNTFCLSKILKIYIYYNLMFDSSKIIIKIYGKTIKKFKYIKLKTNLLYLLMSNLGQRQQTCLPRGNNVNLWFEEVGTCKTKENSSDA